MRSPFVLYLLAALICASAFHVTGLVLRGIPSTLLLPLSVFVFAVVFGVGLGVDRYRRGR